jgi:acetyl esterase/lipase
MIITKPFTLLNKFCQTAWGTIAEILSGTPPPVMSWGFRMRFSVIFLRHLLKHHRGTSLQDARDLIQMKPDFTTLPYHKINITIPAVFREKAHLIIRRKLERELGVYPADESTNWQNCGPLRAEWITSNTEYPCDHHTLLYIHGGGFILGSIHSHRHALRRLTKGANCQVLGNLNS